MFVLCGIVEYIFLLIIRLIWRIIKGFVKTINGTVEQQLTIMFLTIVLIINASISKHIDWADIFIFFTPMAYCANQANKKIENKN